MDFLSKKYILLLEQSKYYFLKTAIAITFAFNFPDTVELQWLEH